MTSKPKSQSNSDSNRNANCRAEQKAGKTTSSNEEPLKPEWAPYAIEGMATFTAVAELIAWLAGDDPSQPSSVFADLVSDINQAREQSNKACAESLLISMPLHLAVKEIERLRCYEARMLTEKRREMNAIRKSAASNFAKRSQEMKSGSSDYKVPARKTYVKPVWSGKKRPNPVSAEFYFRPSNDER